MKHRKWKRAFALCVSLGMSLPMISGFAPASMAVYAEQSSKEPLLLETGMHIENGQGGADVSHLLDTLKPLEEGTIQIRYRSSASQGLSAMLSMSSTQSGQQNTYAVAYVNPSANTVGVEIRDTAGGNYNQVSVSAAGIRDDKWHTITYSFGRSTFAIYVDGEKKTEQEKSGFYNKLSAADTLLIGNQKRTNSSGQWQFTGDLESVQVYDHVLSSGEIQEYHGATSLDPRIPDDPADAVRTDQKLFYNNYEGSRAYRIPSLLTTKQGTLIAAIDKRNSGSADQGNIDTVIKRSTDGGKTWQATQTLIDLPSGANGQCAMTIDASMLQDQQTGRIMLLVDMFPESNAIMNTSLLAAHSGYKEVNGKKYFVLRDYADGNTAETSIEWSTEYTIREEGVVYNETTGEPTEYTVENLTEGTLYKTVDGVKTDAGNIYLYTSADAGELKAIRTCHLWMVSSEDDGQSWSEPVDLNAGLKEDWMLFMGTGPGVGYQMENGRLVFPYYATNANVGASQSSGVIYSDDHGKTWQRGQTVCDAIYEGGTETMSGGAMMTESQVVGVKNSEGQEILKLFCRNTGASNVRIFTSENGGESWNSTFTTDSALREPYCQLSVIPYPYPVEGYEGRQMLLFANPDSTSRSQGAVQLGYYDEQTDSFVWTHKRSITDGSYAYSCLTTLPDGSAGLFWEGDNLDMNYTGFNLSWLMADKTPIPRDAPRALKAVLNAENELVVTFDQPLLVMKTPMLRVKAGQSEANLPLIAGSGSSELVFDASSVSGALELLGFDAGSDGWAGNGEGTAIDADSLSGLAVSGTSEATITGLSVTPGYSSCMIRFDSVPGTVYQIERSSKKSYGYTAAGTVTADSAQTCWQDASGAGSQYYYRITANSQQDCSAVVRASMETGKEAFQANAELYRNLSQTRFDGNTVVDLSEYADVLQTMDQGSLVIQFYTERSALQALFNAAGANASGGMNNNAQMASVMTQTSNALRADLAHTRANTKTYAPGSWHTILVSCANQGKTFRLVVDGAEDHSWTASNLKGFLSTVPDLARVEVGGRMVNGAVTDGFTGRIQYVAVTSEVIDDESAAILTAEVPADETLEIESVKAGYASSRIALKSTGEADIWRCAQADGTYEKIGTTSNGVFFDKTAPEGSLCFYKAISADGTIASEPVQADRSAGREAMKANALIYEEVSGTEFDGSTMVDLSSQASSAANLASGTVVIRFRTDDSENTGVLLMGKKAGETVNMNAASNKAAISITSRDGYRGPRFDFPHTRASIPANAADGQWHTLVISQDAADASSTFRLTLDGKEYGNFSGAANTGFFSKVSGMDTLTIGGFANGSQTSVSNGFNGDIDYVLVTDEILDTEAANRLSRQENGIFSDISTRLFDASPDNTWVIAGGANAEGGYAQTGTARSYAGQFEEYIRWTKSGSIAGRQRYVINSGETGASLRDFDAEFESRIGAFHPKAVCVLAGSEDADDPDLGATLASLKDKVLSLRENSSYLVLQTPPPAEDPAVQAALDNVSQAVRTFYAGLDETAKERVVLVDHAAKAGAFAGKTDTRGHLNAYGHLEMARQLTEIVYGSTDGFPVSEQSLAISRNDALPVLEQRPSANLTGSTLKVHLHDGSSAQGWTAQLHAEGLTFTQPFKEDGSCTFEIPASLGQASFILTCSDGTRMLQPLSGRFSDPASIGTLEENPEETSALQQAILEKTSGDAPLTWLFMGDSITHGALHTSGCDSVAQSFEKHLKGWLGRSSDTVINTAVSGAMTSDTLENIDVRLNDYNPDVCILMFGTNDAVGLSDAQFKANLKQLVAAVRAKNAIPVLRTPNPLRGSDTRKVNLIRLCALIRETAEEENVLLVDHEAAWNESLETRSYLWNNGFWNNDSIHPNAAGQHEMTKELLEGLGLDDPRSPLMQITYPIALQESTSEQAPAACWNEGQAVLSLDAVDASGTAGLAEVSAVSGDLTVSLSAPLENGSITLPLDPAKDWTVSVRLLARDSADAVQLAQTVLEKEAQAADYTLLEMAAAHAAALEKPAHIHPLVWSRFESALETANALLADRTASQEEVDAAWKELCRCVHMLSFTADKSPLEALIEQAETIDLENYEDGPAKDAFLEALETARTVAANETALDPSIEEAMNALQQAIDALQPKAPAFDTSLLAFVIEHVSDTDLSLYANPQAEKEAFMNALSHGQSVLQAPQSQEEIDQAAVDLHTAWLNLRLKPSEEMLKSLQDALAHVRSLSLEKAAYSERTAVSAWMHRSENALQDPHVSASQIETLLQEYESLTPILQNLPAATADAADAQKPAARPAGAASVSTAAASQTSLWQTMSAAAAAALSALFFRRRRK